MNRVEQIEAAIASLPPEEYRRLANWFLAREQSRWDAQMDGDSVAGKLDFLFREAESESIEFADQDFLDVARSRAAEQEVLDLIDVPPVG